MHDRCTCTLTHMHTHRAKIRTIMTAPKYGLEVYLTLLFIPVLLVFLFFTTAQIISTIHNSRAKSWHKPVSAGWSGIIKVTFIGNFRREKIIGTNEKFYILFDYYVSPKFVRHIALLCLSLWQSLIISFWITFLVITSPSCQFGSDCFDNQFNFIENCATFNSDEQFGPMLRV